MFSGSTAAWPNACAPLLLASAALSPVSAAATTTTTTRRCRRCRWPLEFSRLALLRALHASMGATAVETDVGATTGARRRALGGRRGGVGASEGVRRGLERFRASSFQLCTSPAQLRYRVARSAGTIRRLRNNSSTTKHLITWLAPRPTGPRGAEGPDDGGEREGAQIAEGRA